MKFESPKLVQCRRTKNMCIFKNENMNLTRVSYFILNSLRNFSWLTEQTDKIVYIV